MKYGQKQQRMGKRCRFPCFALVMVKRRIVYYLGSHPAIDDILQLTNGAVNKGTIYRSAGRVQVKHSGRCSILRLTRRSLPTPVTEAAKEGNRFCNLDKERLYGQNCQTGAVTFPPKTEQPKMTLQGKLGNNIHTTHSPASCRTPSKVLTDRTQPKARGYGSQWRESIQDSALQAQSRNEEDREHNWKVKEDIQPVD